MTVCFQGSFEEGRIGGIDSSSAFACEARRIMEIWIENEKGVGYQPGGVTRMAGTDGQYQLVYALTNSSKAVIGRLRGVVRKEGHKSSKVGDDLTVKLR